MAHAPEDVDLCGKTCLRASGLGWLGRHAMADKKHVFTFHGPRGEQRPGEPADDPKDALISACKNLAAALDHTSK